MVHIVIIAHSELAYGFKYCVEQIFSNNIEHLHVIGVNSATHTSVTFNKITDLLNQLSRNEAQVLLLTDIFGATPHNIAAKLIIKDKIELITGLNLAMLIRAVSYAHRGIEECVQKTIEGGIAGIMHIDDNTKGLEQHEPN